MGLPCRIAHSAKGSLGGQRLPNHSGPPALFLGVQEEAGLVGGADPEGVGQSSWQQLCGTRQGAGPC